MNCRPARSCGVFSAIVLAMPVMADIEPGDLVEIEGFMPSIAFGDQTWGSVDSAVGSFGPHEYGSITSYEDSMGGPLLVSSTVLPPPRGKTAAGQIEVVWGLSAVAVTSEGGLTFNAYGIKSDALNKDGTLVDPNVIDSVEVDFGNVSTDGFNIFWDDGFLPRFPLVIVITWTQDSVCAGDLDHDGDVDQADLGTLLASFGMDGSGDTDGDGDTDQADLGTLLSEFGGECVPKVIE